MVTTRKYIFCLHGVTLNLVSINSNAFWWQVLQNRAAVCSAEQKVNFFYSVSRAFILGKNDFQANSLVLYRIISFQSDVTFTWC